MKQKNFVGQCYFFIVRFTTKKRKFFLSNKNTFPTENYILNIKKSFHHSQGLRTFANSFSSSPKQLPRRMKNLTTFKISPLISTSTRLLHTYPLSERYSCPHSLPDPSTFTPVRSRYLSCHQSCMIHKHWMTHQPLSVPYYYF